MPQQTIWSRLVMGLATGFGLGCMPVASGTFGALLGLPLALALTTLQGRTDHWLLWQIGICLLLTLLAIPICDAAEKSLGTKDDGRIVADEFLTLPICVIGLPLAAMLRNGQIMQSLFLLGTAFVLSRICDILKPTPARQLQRLKGGLGIVLDDFFASIYALILIHGVLGYIEKHIFPLLERTFPLLT